MKIISIFGIENVKCIKEAWLNSRPKEDREIPVDKIIPIDLPVNEFGRVSMFIETTVLAREFFSSFSGHVMWSQSSRVEDVTKFETPFFLNENEKFMSMCKEIREDMIERQDSGERQEEFRLTMPIMALCRYSVNVSARELLKLLSFLWEMESSGEYEHLSRWLDDFTLGVMDALLKIGLTVEQIALNKYKSAAIMRSVNEHSSDGRVGNTCVVTAIVPFNLRTHIARHRKIMLRDNLLERMRGPEFMYALQDAPIKVEISGLVEDMTEVFSRRSCWIAHYALWSEVLNKINYFLELDEQGLPCANGKCPFNQDCEARYIGTDPNAPCPRHANLYSRAVTPALRQKMIDQAVIDQRPDFWRAEIDKVKVEE